jgi:hypothetical protein
LIPTFVFIVIPPNILYFNFMDTNKMRIRSIYWSGRLAGFCDVSC